MDSRKPAHEQGFQSYTEKQSRAYQSGKTGLQALNEDGNRLTKDSAFGTRAGKALLPFPVKGIIIAIAQNMSFLFFIRNDCSPGSITMNQSSEIAFEDFVHAAQPNNEYLAHPLADGNMGFGPQENSAGHPNSLDILCVLV